MTFKSVEIIIYAGLFYYAIIMNFMKNGILEAMQNPDFEKIRKAVILNRHAEAKDFEEALQKEMQYNCYVILNKEHTGYNSWKQSFDKNLPIVIKGICESAITVGYSDEYHNEFISAGSSTETPFSLFIPLGKPITLEDILSLLNHQPWENRGWIEAFQIRETVNKGEYHINIYDKDYTSIGLCFWRLTKPLHEQTTETWEKIANLLI